MIEFMRNFLGDLPPFDSLYDLPNIFEYIFAGFMLLAVMVSIYAIFGSIIKFFRR